MKNNSLGYKIRNFRKAKGYSQEKLAEMATLSQQHISRIENADVLPDLRTIIKITDVLEIEPGDILELRSPKEKAECIHNIIKYLNLLNENEHRRVLGYIECLLEDKKFDK